MFEWIFFNEGISPNFFFKCKSWRLIIGSWNFVSFDKKDKHVHDHESLFAIGSHVDCYIRQLTLTLEATMICWPSCHLWRTYSFTTVLTRFPRLVHLFFLLLILQVLWKKILGGVFFKKKADVNFPWFRWELQGLRCKCFLSWGKIYFLKLWEIGSWKICFPISSHQFLR